MTHRAADPRSPPTACRPAPRLRPCMTIGGSPAIRASRCADQQPRTNNRGPTPADQQPLANRSRRPEDYRYSMDRRLIGALLVVVVLSAAIAIPPLFTGSRIAGSASPIDLPDPPGVGDCLLNPLRTTCLLYTSPSPRDRTR